MSLDRKFNGDSKNVLKYMIGSLQMGFTCYFVSDCPFNFFFAILTLTAFFFLIVLDFQESFYVIR